MLKRYISNSCLKKNWAFSCTENAKKKTDFPMPADFSFFAWQKICKACNILSNEFRSLIGYQKIVQIPQNIDLDNIFYEHIRHTIL